MSNKTGGPAFPEIRNVADKYEWESESGMTLRDYIAIKAMAAIVRRYDGHSFGGGQESPQYKELSEDAYAIADAMLKVREAKS